MSGPSPEPAAAAIACVEAFTAAFNARDVAGMDAVLHFPHVILADENLIIWKAPGRLPPTYFDELAAAAGAPAPITTSKWCWPAHARCTCC